MGTSETLALAKMVACASRGHKAVHDAEARIKAARGMGRNQYFKRAKHNIRVMYQAMEEVLVRREGVITQSQLRNMRKQAEKFAKSKGCH